MPSKAITLLINTYKPINTITITVISWFPNYSAVLCSFSSSVRGTWGQVWLTFSSSLKSISSSASGNHPILPHSFLWSPCHLVNPLEASLGHLKHWLVVCNIFKQPHPKNSATCVGLGWGVGSVLCLHTYIAYMHTLKIDINRIDIKRRILCFAG